MAGVRAWRSMRGPVVKAAIATLGVSAAVFFVLRPAHGIDDADITLVYARNIASGAGYVYTPGGERVEGSTSLAWTLICALAFRFARGGAMLPLFGLAFVMTFAAIGASLEIARRSLESKPAVLWTCLLILASPAFFAWTTTTLMDVALWSMCIGLALLQTVAPYSRAGILRTSLVLVTVVLARPEGLAVAATLLAVGLLARALSGMTFARAVRTMIVPFVATTGFALALVAFRLAYFGFPVPNTYFAKVGGDPLYTAVRGCAYVLKFFVRNPVHVFGALATLWTLRNDGPAAWDVLRGKRVALEPAAIVRLSVSTVLITAVSLPLFEGEDHFVASRLFQPFVPLSCALMGSLIAKWLESAESILRIRMAMAGIALACAIGWTRFVAVEATDFKKELGLASTGRLMARRLQEHLDQGAALPSMGVTAAGGIAFAYRGRVMDLLGLNWVKMAHASRDRRGRAGHAAFSADVFWSEPATLVVPQFLDAEPYDACDMYSSWWEEILRGLPSSARFRDEYTGLSIATPDGHLSAYVRKDWLSTHTIRDARGVDWPSGNAPCPGRTHEADGSKRASRD